MPNDPQPASGPAPGAASRPNGAGAPIDPAREHADTIADIHHEVLESLDRHQRSVERLTAALGRPRTLYFIVALLAGWTAVNSIWAHAWDPPPFPLLQGLVSALALLTATMVLITQNRLARHNERRSQLDLHVNLTAEQRTAKVIQLLEELRRDLPTVRDRHDPEAEALQSPANARDVLATLDRMVRRGP